MGCNNPDTGHGQVGAGFPHDRMTASVFDSTTCPGRDYGNVRPGATDRQSFAYSTIVRNLVTVQVNGKHATVNLLISSTQIDVLLKLHHSHVGYYAPLDHANGGFQSGVYPDDTSPLDDRSHYVRIFCAAEGT